MPCDSCQRLGEAMLGVLGLLVLGCVGLNTSSLLWLHLRPLVQHLIRLLTPKLDARSRLATPPARPRRPPAAPGGLQPPTGRPKTPPGGPSQLPAPPGQRPPPGLEMEEPRVPPGARRAPPHSLGGHPAPRPAHRARVYVSPLPESPGWTPLPPSPGGVASEGWLGDSAGEGGSVYPPSPSFACWNREGSGVLR